MRLACVVRTQVRIESAREAYNIILSGLEYLSITAKSKLVSPGVTSKLAKYERGEQRRSACANTRTPFAASLFARGRTAVDRNISRGVLLGGERLRVHTLNAFIARRNVEGGS